MSGLVTTRFAKNRLIITSVDVSFAIPLISIQGFISVLDRIGSKWCKYDGSVYMHTQYVDPSRPQLGLRDAVTPHPAELTFHAINDYMIELKLAYASEFMKLSVPRSDLRSSLVSAYRYLLSDDEDRLKMNQ